MAKRVLSFGAHPDDIELGCGGAERLLIERGYEAVHVCVTSGESGSRSVARRTLRDLREGEARAAAKVVGAEDVRFLRLPDGLTSFDRRAKIAVMSLVREVRPAVVFVHAAGDGLLDHRVVHDLVLSALAGAAGPWYQQTRRGPCVPRAVLGYEVWTPIQRPGLVVDVTKAMETKLEALACHRSQLAAIDYAAAAEGLARYRGAMSRAGRHAEAFEVISLDASAAGLWA